MLAAVIQAAVQFVTLRLRERQRLREGGDAVPNVFDGLDALREAEFQHVRQ